MSSESDNDDIEMLATYGGAEAKVRDKFSISLTFTFALNLPLTSSPFRFPIFSFSS